MKVKLDENRPVRAAAQLRALGFEVDTVHDEKLVGHAAEIRTWARCVVVATPNKVRVLRPSATHD